MEKVTVICSRCGSIILEEDEIDSCPHISLEEAQGFKDYLKRKLTNKNPKWEYNTYDSTKTKQQKTKGRRKETTRISREIS